MSVKIMGRNKDSSYKLISSTAHNRTRKLKCTVKVWPHILFLVLLFVYFICYILIVVASMVL